MNKLLQILLLVILGVQGVSAMTADEVLAKVAEKVNGAPSITASFTATTGGGETTKGVLTISRERFSMLAADYSTWYDGTNLWTYNSSAGETSLSEPTADELMEINPFDIINRYRGRFAVRLLSQADGKYVVELKPTGRRSSIAKAVVTVSAKTWLPTAITATFSNSATLTVSIPSAKVGGAPAPATFVYPASSYPGVEVIDLR